MIEEREFKVKSNKFIADGIFETVIETADGASLPEIHAGQFLHVKIGRDGLLLRRPFCISGFTENTVTMYIAVVGKGTLALSRFKPGESLSATLPIGNGFWLTDNQKRVALIAGGVGTAALTSLMYTYPDKEYFAYLGYQSKEKIILRDKFEAFATTLVCTDDGSEGYNGYPTDAFLRFKEVSRPDVILTCGSEPFLKAVAAASVKSGIPAYMSGESRMGCGVGACLVCACRIKGEDGNIIHRRACVDGPVFNLKDVIL